MNLTVAVYQASEQYAAKSLLHFGDSKRNFEQGQDTPLTSGDTDVAIVPAAQKLA